MPALEARGLVAPARSRWRLAEGWQEVEKPLEARLFDAFVDAGPGLKAYLDRAAGALCALGGVVTVPERIERLGDDIHQALRAGLERFRWTPARPGMPVVLRLHWMVGDEAPLPGQDPEDPAAVPGWLEENRHRLVTYGLPAFASACLSLSNPDLAGQVLKRVVLEELYVLYA